MRPYAYLITSVAFLIALSAPTLTRADINGERLFSLEVKSLLQQKCFACHGDDPAKIKGGLNLLSREAMLQGGETSARVLVPGQADQSSLYNAVTWEDEDLEMPPKENDRLTDEQITTLRDWINAGAPWPDEATQKRYRDAAWAIKETEAGVIVETSGGLSDEWTYRRYQPEDLWAFRPLAKPSVPAPADSTQEVNPVDAFLDARRATSGFSATSAADPLTLIRRATYDLTGLPPKPEAVQRFRETWLEHPDQAWSELIDRLLASPHYGERWAQHWLDVVRYADTGGYSNDYERSNAWRYRDYVVRAFNDDKPYDQFVVEQLAGDELADESVRRRKGSDDEIVHNTRLSGDYNAQESEWLVATGFLRMGPWDNAMVKDDEARQIYLDDVVNVVGQTFLSTTMRCFKCHDHKFDPLPTRDYYRFYAAFSGTQMAERKVPFLPSENRENFTEGEAHTRRMLAFATAEKNRIKEKQDKAARAWFAEHDLEYVPENQRKDLPDEKKPPRHVGLDHVDEGQLKVREQDEWIWTRRLERYQPMIQSVYNGSNQKAVWNKARKLRVAKTLARDWRPNSAILLGGTLAAPGEKVGPGVLSGTGIPLKRPTTEDPYRLPDTLEGRRLGLARWIANPQNPLTSRSIVNRVWQHHFVKPLAGNPNNFGAKGAKPSHPELLDYLAVDFAEHGWTFKRLHRLIMTSRAYRRSSGHPEMASLQSKDPDNALLAYYPPRRLTAEELRDSFLAVTGELNPALAGLPQMPEINMEVALQPRMIQFSLAPAYQPSRLPDQRNRRTLYAYRVRGMADPFLELFNQPNPNDSCEARDSAALTPQAFSLLNSTVAADRSIAFARRLTNEAQDLEQQIQRAFLLAFGRDPSDEEHDRMSDYVKRMHAYHTQKQPTAVSYPTKITRSVVEEFSGKPFEYEEILPIFEDYVPDTKASDVSAEVRSLADLCLLLFNSNEFVYIY